MILQLQSCTISFFSPVSAMYNITAYRWSSYGSNMKRINYDQDILAVWVNRLRSSVDQSAIGHASKTHRLGLVGIIKQRPFSQQNSSMTAPKKARHMHPPTWHLKWTIAARWNLHIEVHWPGRCGIEAALTGWIWGCAVDVNHSTL